MATGPGFEWGTVAAWAGFSLSLVVAINQFFSSRPRISYDRPVHAESGSFVIKVWNSSPVPIHLFGYWAFTSKRNEHRSLSSKVGMDYVDWWHPLGTINLIVPPDGVSELNATVMPRRWLLFAIGWRRMTGLHLFAFVPLLAVASPARLAAIAEATRAPMVVEQGRER